MTSPLTRQQLNQLRKSKSVSFSHSKGEGTIVAIHQWERGDERGIRFEIPVTSRVRSCRSHQLPAGAKPLEQVASCHELMHVDCGDTGLEWRSITAFLKPGDELTLAWGADYESNGYMDDAGLHGDRLTLKIDRGNKKFGFVLVVHACKDNTARMIRRGPFNNE